MAPVEGWPANELREIARKVFMHKRSVSLVNMFPRIAGTHKQRQHISLELFFALSPMRADIDAFHGDP